jgi:hypothetical protein
MSSYINFFQTEQWHVRFSSLSPAAVVLLLVWVLIVVENLAGDMALYVEGPALLPDASQFVLAVAGLDHGPCLFLLVPPVLTSL